MTERDDFTCTVTNWEYIYGRCRSVADQVRRTEFEPEVVVALARGGWFAGRCLCDFLGLDDLTSLKMEHYVGTAAKTGEPEIRYPMPEGSVEGKDVLIIDDIADTGGASSVPTNTSPTAIRTTSAPRPSNCSGRASSNPTTSASISTAGRG